MLFPVYWLLIIVRGLLFVVCCVLFADSLLVVRCSLLVVDVCAVRYLRCLVCR